MKKSLPVILSTAMAVSMFASVASADTAATTTAAPAVKTSADFKDLANIDATLKAKIDALLAKGYFEGVSEDTFGINDNMTRAQFAKIATLVFGIAVDTNVKTSSFSDVKADDAANGWAVAYIEAAKKAGLIDGVTDTTFVPGDNVTVGQFDTVLLKGLKKTVDVSGTPWYADAVKQAVELKIHGADKDGAAFASRTDLVVGAFAGVEAFAELNKPAQVSVTEAKATGVQKVEVKLDKDVDTSKATLTLKKGSTAVATDVKWADDKKSATLTLKDVKVGEGTYTVTLGGLDATAVKTATASFTGEKEKVVKLSFVNASDKVAKSEVGKKIKIKLKPENQYGEVATVNGTEYTANVAGTTDTPKRNSDTGLLELEVDTSDNTKYPIEVGVLPITVSLNQSTVFAQKTFKIGYAQVVSKVELGTPKYAAGKTAISKDGDKVEIEITRFDQYGDEITTDLPATLPQPVVTPSDLNILKKEFDLDDKKLIISVDAGKKVEKSAEHTVTYYEGGASATAKINLKASAIPAKLEFGSFDGTLAAGEVKDQYIPIVAYDADGKQLTADEIVDAASLISVSITGATKATDTTVDNGIVRYGEHKGQLKITSVTAGEKGIVYFFVSIYNANIQTQAQLSLTVQPARAPETIVLTGDDATKKALESATTKFKVLVKDQYGDTLDSAAAGYSVDLTVTGSTYASVSVNDVVYTTKSYSNTEFGDLNDKEVKFTANNAGQYGKAKVALVLKKGAAELKTFERTVEVINSKDLTYAAKAATDIYGTSSVDASKAAPFNTLAGSFAKKLDVTVTDKAGDTVAVPSKVYTSVFSSDPSVVQVGLDGTDGKVLGLKAGKATITAVLLKANNESQEFKYEVNVKADAPVVSTLTTKANKVYTNNTDIATLIEAKVVDSYGVEYEKAAIAPYNTFLGVQYVISDVKGGGSAKIDAAGKLQITGNVDELVVKAISSNGKVATTVLTKI